MSIADVQQIVMLSPYLSWLGIEVLKIDQDEIDARAIWRQEWIANPTIGQTQGGILAALLDFAGDFALFPRLGRPVPTIDLRVDYHRMAKQGDLFMHGRVVKFGSQFATCDAQLFDHERSLLASARGTYLTAQR